VQCLSLDYSVRSSQHIRRDREADLFSCFQIDDELKLRRLLYRQISRLGTFQNLVYITRRTTDSVDTIRVVAHEATRVHKLRNVIHRQQTILNCEIYNPLLVVNDESPKRHNYESFCSLLASGVECLIQILRTAHLQRLNLHPQRTGSYFCFLKLRGGDRSGGIPENGHTRCPG